MIKQIKNETIEALRQEYARGEVPRRLFDWFAGRQNDARETTIERASAMARVDESEARELFKKLEALDLGQLIVGRRGHRTRFAWRFSVRSIGAAARSEAGKLDAIDEDDLEAADVDPVSLPSETEGHLAHEYRLRPDLVVSIRLPPDLTDKESDRLASWIRTLPY